MKHLDFPGAAACRQHRQRATVPLGRQGRQGALRRHAARRRENLGHQGAAIQRRGARDGGEGREERAPHCAEQEKDYRKRQAEAGKATDKADAERSAQASGTKSARGRGNPETLESGQRIARTDAKGERYTWTKTRWRRKSPKRSRPCRSPARRRARAGAGAVSAVRENDMAARILVVDDDESLCELLRMHLASAGYEVSTRGRHQRGLPGSEESA